MDKNVLLRKALSGPGLFHNAHLLKQGQIVLKDQRQEKFIHRNNSLSNLTK